MGFPRSCGIISLMLMNTCIGIIEVINMSMAIAFSMCDTMMNNHRNANKDHPVPPPPHPLFAPRGCRQPDGL